MILSKNAPHHRVNSDWLTRRSFLGTLRAHKQGLLNMGQMVSVQKIYLSNLILALTKWLEFYKHYHDLIPEEFRSTVKSTNKVLNEKKVRKFRNKCIGHV